MGVDAVFILRPKDHSKLRKYIKSKEAGRFEPLEDGTVLLHSFMSYGWWESEPHEARNYLESVFEKDLEHVHDDERGVLVFADVCEPADTQSYDAIVTEMEEGGFWVPLSDDPKAKKNAEKLRARQEKAAAKRKKAARAFLAHVEDLMERGVAPGDPEAQSLMDGLGDLSSMFVKDPKPDVAVWCPLVKRKTPIEMKYDGEANELIVLSDKSTAIYVVDYGSLDDMSWRLSSETQYAHWVAQHSDARGVPVFSSEHLKKVRGARSYDAALKVLGEHVRWITPKGIEEREAEREAKLDALVRRKPKAKAKAKAKTKAATKPKKKTRARKR